MVAQNCLRVQERIREACVRAGRDPAGVRLVAISKGRTAGEVLQALEAGVSEIGENRVQEARLKYGAILNTRFASSVRWHMVGHLQTNKVKDAVRLFDLIESVDSLRLAQEINAQAVRLGKIQDILIEVKTSPEESKYGIAPDECAALIERVKALGNVRLRGLMTVAPLVESPQKARPYFRLLRELRDSLRSAAPELDVLSMGMTDDFEVAIEEGSTMVRLGRALFDSNQ